MKLRTMFFLYMRGRIVSWLNMDTQITYVYLNSMEKCAVASFTNGKMDKPQGFSDTIPPDWSGGQSSE